MNELDLLKEFRSELGADPGQDHMEASWAKLQQRMGTSPGSTFILTRPRVRRWAVPVAIAAAAAVLLALSITLPAGFPGGTRRAAAAISFTEDGRYIVAVIQDPQADSEALSAAFTQHSLDITLKLLPVSPSFVGKVVEQDTSGGSDIETLFDENADCTTPGSTSCPIGLRIPLDFHGQANITLGRAGEPGEEYASVNDAFAPGELLHCSGLRGMTVQQAALVLSQVGVTAMWRSNDSTIDKVDGIDPSTISDQYVTDALPLSQGSVYVWAAPQPAPTPEPGTPLANYYDRLNRGC
jgi:hypothetical protein